MLQRISVITALVICVAGPSAYGKKNPKEVEKKVEKSMAVESGIQKAADDWNLDKQRIIQEIRDLKYRTTGLKYRQEKTRLYKEEFCLKPAATRRPSQYLTSPCP